jgi:hypothetical protein
VTRRVGGRILVETTTLAVGLLPRWQLTAAVFTGPRSDLRGRRTSGRENSSGRHPHRKKRGNDFALHVASQPERVSRQTSVITGPYPIKRRSDALRKLLPQRASLRETRSSHGCARRAVARPRPVQRRPKDPPTLVGVCPRYRLPALGWPCSPGAAQNGAAASSRAERRTGDLCAQRLRGFERRLRFGGLDFFGASRSPRSWAERWSVAGTACA